LEKYRQRLVVEIPVSIPDVIADPRRIEQVLVNLLSNASKYGPTEAKIKIFVEKDQDFVRVHVADRGHGIPRDQRKQVFFRFTRPGPATDIAKVGARLGLSVVKAVVEAHGGKVGVDDHPNGGAIFWFTLPVATGS
ncbi:MAG: ATP-binding protein, partial [Anaerolineales bacterium]|nr:ATP-binding protein [Anaerolineales bacterium]